MNRSLVGGLIVLLVGAGYWWLNEPMPESVPRPEPASATDATPEPAPERTRGTGVSALTPLAVTPVPEVIASIEPATVFDPQSWPALPAENEPLNQIVDTLRARSDQGDHKAACRLALEFAACDDAIGHLQFQEQQARRRSELEPEQQADLIRDMEEALKRSEGCEVLAGVPEWERWRYIRQAARAGNVAAMELYAFDATRIVMGSRLSSVELKTLLGERDAMLMAAARAGSDDAIRALILRFSPMGSGLALDLDAGLTEVERAQMVEALRQISLAGEKRHIQIKGLGILNDQEIARVAELEQHFMAARASVAPQQRVVEGDENNARCEAGYLPAPDLRQAVDWRQEFGMNR